MTSEQLPALPEPQVQIRRNPDNCDFPTYDYAYTADQMHAFRAAGVREAIEACAKLCESQATFVHPMAQQGNQRGAMAKIGNQTTEREHFAALRCAAAIRATLPRTDQEQA